jgi:hypothetical protein
VPGPRALTATLVVALGVFLGGSAAWAQFPGRTPGTVLFPDLPVRGPIVLYPTLTLGVEYNDNVFLRNDRKRSDYIGSVTPGLQVILEGTTYRWAAGYSLTGEKYLDNSELDNAVQRQNLFITGSQRLTPQFTLTLNEVFVEDNNTNFVGTDNIAVGRQKARSNVFAPGFAWFFLPKTSLRVEASYTLQRYDDPAAADSNVYRLTADLNHEFTSRIVGILGYEARYIDVERQFGVTTHTARVGMTYRFTPLTTATAVVGPTVRVTRNESPSLSPYADATITSLFSWGSATAYFQRSVGTAGGAGGTTENTSFGGLVQVTSLVRDLILEAGPRYSIAESTGGGGAIDVRSFALDLRATYRFTSWLAGIAGYRLFLQRSDSASTSIARDVDQNRVFLGAQFGFPVKFD